jgi:hypothetical protein
LLFYLLQLLVLHLHVLVELLERFEDVVLVVAEDGAVRADHLLVGDAHDLQGFLVLGAHPGLHALGLSSGLHGGYFSAALGYYSVNRISAYYGY